MTPLTRPVTRTVDFGRGPVAVTLHPSGFLMFRERYRHTTFYLHLGAAFVEAVGRAVAARHHAKNRKL